MSEVERRHRAERECAELRRRASKGQGTANPDDFANLVADVYEPVLADAREIVVRLQQLPHSDSRTHDGLRSLMEVLRA